MTRRESSEYGADFQVCCISGFQTRGLHQTRHSADREVGDTTGLETCAAGCGVRPVAESRMDEVNSARSSKAFNDFLHRIDHVNKTSQGRWK
jgi:hypothetical protein